MSAMRNMNLRMPSRRLITAESDMAIVRPLCFGCEIRANTMPMVMASMIMPSTDCTMISHAAAQHSLGYVFPYPA